MNSKKIFAAAAAFVIASLTGCEKVSDEPAEAYINVITTTTVETTTMASEIETTVSETEAETTETVREPLVVLERFQETQKKYPDIAGHITVPNTNIDYDFVQTTDNDFYLNRDMDGNDDKHGTIFLDYRCNFNDFEDKQSNNILLHGHNMADLTMFGSLQRYKIKQNDTSRFDFYLQNPTFTVSNLYEEYTYKIFAMFVVEVEEWQTRDGKVFDYQNFIRFAQNYSFDNWIANVNKRNEIITDIDVNKDDQFITLNTCSNEFRQSRFIVIARKVRDGENPEVDTSTAQLNPSVQEPDWNYIYSVAE